MSNTDNVSDTITFVVMH